MARRPVSRILTQYDCQKGKLDSFAQEAEHLLDKLLQADGIRVHAITSRVKSRESLERKLRRPDRRYSQLADVTDIIGIRVITLFSDDVDRVAELVRREFAVDEANSVDRRVTTEPDRFGYQSLHFVVGMSSTRVDVLGEYRAFKGLKAEIQVRSILQHAWAEIEHDLGYKTSEAIPTEFRRRFSRNAGLLEIADSEFVYVRNGLAEYDKRLARDTKESPEFVALDLNSISAFIKQDKLVNELDEAIAKHYSVPVGFESEFVGGIVLKLQKTGFRTLSEVSSELSRLARVILALEAKENEMRTDLGEISGVVAGCCLVYLCYAVLAEKSEVARISELTNHNDAERILAAYGAVKASSA